MEKERDTPGGVCIYSEKGYTRKRGYAFQKHKGEETNGNPLFFKGFGKQDQ